MSLFDSLLGDGDETTESDSTEGDPFLEGGGDDLGGGGGDPFSDAGDDFGGDAGDEFGAFDEMEDDGADNAELENRMDELENEVSSLSSSVNTIKSENEEISGSLEDIEENVRQLLEIYEMVTRGVNPFVDDSDVSATSGSMELFDTSNESESTAEVDEDIANADASDFFDDDIDEDEGDQLAFDNEDDGDELSLDDEVDSGALEDDPVADFDMSEEVDPTGSTDGDSSMEENSGDKSFEDLKAEYESGDAEWAAEDDGDGDFPGDDDSEAAPTSDSTIDEPESEAAESFDDAVEAVAEDPGEEPISDSGNDTVGDRFDDAEDDLESAAAVPETDPKERNDAPSDSVDAGGASTETKTGQSGTGEKPYLDELPAGYVSDLVVMDWLEFLIEASDVENAARAIAYYESISWVSESVAEMLRKFLDGFDGSEHLESDPLPHPSLDVDHHTQSLKYIARLEGPSPGAAAMGSWNLDGRRQSTRPATPAPESSEDSDQPQTPLHDTESGSTQTEPGTHEGSSGPVEDGGPEPTESVPSPSDAGQSGGPARGEAASDGSGEPTGVDANDPVGTSGDEPLHEADALESPAMNDEPTTSTSQETGDAPVGQSQTENSDEPNAEDASADPSDSGRHSSDGSGWPLARTPPRYEPVGPGPRQSVDSNGDRHDGSHEADHATDSLPGESTFGYGSRYTDESADEDD